MKRIGLIIFLGSACGMPAGLDLERNNPVDPQADPASQRCGNGIINSGEECDDGNRIATDSCTDSCKLAVCGDGHVRTDLGPSEADFESCDEGEANANTAGCLEGCVVARCGDGLVRDDVAPGEPGLSPAMTRAIDTDDCTNRCLLNVAATASRGRQAARELLRAAPKRAIALKASSVSMRSA